MASDSPEFPRATEVIESGPNLSPPIGASPLGRMEDARHVTVEAIRGADLLEMLERVAPASPQWAVAQYRRARILASQSRVNEALDAVGEAIRTGGEDPGSLALQGDLLVRAGRPEDAERTLERAVQLGTTDRWAYLNLGYLLHGQDRHEEAVTALRKGLRIAPDDAQLVAHLGRFLLAAGHVAEADVVMADAAHKHANVPLVQVFRSWVMSARADLAGAAECMRKAIDLDPGKADWHAHLARLLLQQGLYAESVQAVTHAARLDPTSETIRKLGELVLARRARVETAISAQCPEAVRLVIWDLDETFWRGTVTEGGIQEYVQAHHDLVIELARRGIMSSICSKNDANVIAKILEQRGIAEYFIFPSVSWEPKGPRIAALIEAVQLRAATVMFIDDNPLNRAEASATVPGLQVEDEHFVGRMLADERFKGKHDANLTRLAQYKLLERRKQDEIGATAEGNSEAFLRGCDIRVHIDYDVIANLDRAIELVNRTNQLNFTKRRLSEDLEQARSALTEEIRPFFRQAGLVRVTDRYGDYGFVGFFVIQRSTAEGARGGRLLHFCFSCRTLGMLVEKWVYDHLGRPELRVAGEVLTDLSLERTIDWISLGTGQGASFEQPGNLAPEIRFVGGCETSALSFYLNARSPKIVVRGNFASNALFFRLNGVDLLLSYAQRSGPEFAEEAIRLGMPVDLGAFDLFGDGPEGTVLVVNCSKDFSYGVQQFRHKTRGWVVAPEASPRPHLNLLTTDPDRLRAELDEIFTDPEARATVSAVAGHLRDAYVFEREPFSLPWVEAGVRRIVARVRPGAKLIFVLDHPVVRDLHGTLFHLPNLARANEHVRAIAREFAFVGTVSFSDSITGDDQIQAGGNHYDRAVYIRLAEALAARIAEIRPRDSLIG